MQSNHSRPHPAIYDSADNRLRFGVSNVGELNDSVYREQESSKFYSKLIGRQYIPPHSKSNFTASDVVCEGYLYKKGSWLKNWKKRYFVLRKDIRALCYYSSREDLTLLGSIPLDLETRLVNVKPHEADDYSNVISIETELEDGSNTKTFIKFETFERMKAWMIDIKSEAQNMVVAPEDQADWWESIFGSLPTIEPKHNATRRDGGTVIDKDPDPEPASQKIIQSKASSVSDGATDKDQSPPIQDLKLSENAPDSDDETDDEGPPSKGKEISQADMKRRSVNGTLKNSISSSSKIIKKIKHMKPDKPYSPPPFENPTVEKFETSDGCLSGLQISLQLSNVCSYQDRIFVVIFGSAFQSSTEFNATFGSSKKVSSSSNAPGTALSGSQRWNVLSRTEVKLINDKNTYNDIYLPDVKLYFNAMENLIPDSCKDIKIVVYRQENDNNKSNPTLSDLSGHIEIAKTIISKKIFDMKNVMKIKMKVKSRVLMDIAVPLLKNTDVTLGVIKLKSFYLNQYRLWLTKMMNITPYAEVMYSFHTKTGNSHSLESLYASKYSLNMALSLLSLWNQERNEYLYNYIRLLKEELATMMKTAATASNTSPVPDDSDMSDPRNLRGKLVKSLSQTANATPSTAGTSNIPMDDEKLSALFDAFRQSIELIEEIYHDNSELSSIILTHYENCLESKQIMNNVLNPSQGGHLLRRSTWKKFTLWQYCTTNLNVHILLSKVNTFSELHLLSLDSMNDQHSIRFPSSDEFNMSNYITGRRDGHSGFGYTNPHNIHCVPTITLGVPSAHELKFSDGGLRKILLEISTIEHKLLWMQAIQAPDSQTLFNLFKLYPKEGNSLFGNVVYSINTAGGIPSREDLVTVLKRKFELSRRLDICASQALGTAVTLVRTIVQLASLIGDDYFEILARSLRIGFFVMFESLLSTQGAEIGMLEDLEIAVLWLSLVTVRLVTIPNVPSPPSSTPSSHSPISNRKVSRETKDIHLESPPIVSRKKIVSSDGKVVSIGVGDGVICRRANGGRLIVDIEISQEESVVVVDALQYMSAFGYRPTDGLNDPNCSFAFQPDPEIIYSASETRPLVYATAELFGCVFTQGVNEMQTLANLSSSRDVLKQVEINNYSSARLTNFYLNYKAALEFQLSARMPEMIESLCVNNSVSDTSMPNSPMQSLPTVVTSPSSVFSQSPSVSPPPVPGKLSRKKSIRHSISSGNLSSHINSEALKAAVVQLKQKVLVYNDRLRDLLQESISIAATNPYEKHVDILMRSSALARQIGGIACILCKSGKDRTSMAVTLENTRSLVEDLGVQNGSEIVQLMRAQGVRRMNVYANTGQSMFAFNQIQRRALPSCYRPPAGSHAGNVTS